MLNWRLTYFKYIYIYIKENSYFVKMFTMYYYYFHGKMFYNISQFTVIIIYLFIYLL